MISCNSYDYIEVVCLFKYPIELTLKSHEIIVGQAIDTTKNNAREECIKLKIEEHYTLVALDSIHKMQVLVENPHIKEQLIV